MNKYIDRIWALQQRARGAASVRDTCHMLLYAFLLKKHDLEIEFSNHTQEKFYSHLYDCDMDMINSASEVFKAYEAFYKIDKGFLVDTFYQLVNCLREDSIKLILETIGEIEFKSSEELYDTSEAVICKMSEVSGRGFPLFTANPTVAKLEAKLLACGPDMTLYDGFCGSGISVSKVAAKGTKIFMQDINPEMVSIASIVCILGDKNIGAAGCGDALWNVDHDLEFDRIIAEPPIGAKYGKEYVDYMFQNEQIPEKNLDTEALPIFHVLNFLKVDGLAAILLPPGFLFRGGKALNTRKILLEMNVVDTIVDLPEGCLPGMYIPAVLLLLKKNRETDDILMIDAKGFFKREKRGLAQITDEGIDKIEELYKSRAVIAGISATPNRRTIEAADYGFSVAKYVTSRMKLPEKKSINSLLIRYKEIQTQLDAVENELDCLRKRFIK